MTVRACLVAALLLLAPMSARADTFGPSEPIADSYIDSNAPDTNYGTNTTESVLRLVTTKYRTVLVFDISSIPRGSKVTNATLTFKTSAVSGDCTTSCTFKIRNIKRIMTEAGVTWNKYDGGNSWTTAGGDGADTDYINANIAGPFTSPTAVDTTKTITSDSTLNAQVQTSVSAVLFRQVRMMLVIDGEGSGFASFSMYSRDHGTPGNRPTLTIDYTPPQAMRIISQRFDAEGAACGG